MFVEKSSEEIAKINKIPTSKLARMSGELFPASS